MSKKRSHLMARSSSSRGGQEGKREKQTKGFHIFAEWLGNADADGDGRAVAPPRTDLDEEEGSVGGGVAIDVDPSQDNGSHEEDGQHNAHDGAQVHGGPRRLGGQVVLKACEETIRSGD